jgi:hydrogenase-4 component B
VVLILLAILVAALVVLALAAPFVPRAVLRIGSAVMCGGVVLLALASMADEPMLLALPLGLRLVLDPLAACFLLLVFVANAAGALFVGDAPMARAALPASLVAMLLAVLAGDPFTLAAGLLLMGFAVRSTPVAVFGVVCLTAALALAAPHGDFAAIRAAPPEGWRAAAVLILVLLGVTSQAAPGVASPAGTAVWVYVLIRVLFDLCGAAQQSWWGVPLLLLGAAGALAGTLRTSFENRLQPVLSIGSLHQLGLMLVALGTALLARAVDLSGVALFALEAAWLLLVCHVLCRTLLLLCGDAVEAGAGTVRLDRMGGLIHRMKTTASCMLAGLFGTTVMPPSLAFAGAWLLFQSLLVVARSGGFGLQLVIALVVAMTAASSGLAAFAAIRLFGVVFLGRPRTPRTAVADEPPPVFRRIAMSLAALTGILGVVPALALLPAGPALTRLANGAPDALVFALTLRPGAEAPGYDPITIAALLVIAAGGIFWLLQRLAAQQQREETAWSGGFAPPPAWLPFGDPATQYGPASFAEALHRMVMLLLARPLAIARVMGAAFARERDRLLRASAALGRADASCSLAAGLAVLVLAMVAWLVAS